MADEDYPRYFGLWWTNEDQSGWCRASTGMPIAFRSPAPLFAWLHGKDQGYRVAVMPLLGGEPTEFLERPKPAGVSDGG